MDEPEKSPAGNAAMIDLTQHNFRPDKFYTDHWVSQFGNVCTRAEAERIVEIEQLTQRARQLQDAPFVTREQRRENLKQGFELVRRGVE